MPPGLLRFPAWVACAYFWAAFTGLLRAEVAEPQAWESEVVSGKISKAFQSLLHPLDKPTGQKSDPGSGLLDLVATTATILPLRPVEMSITHQENALTVRRAAPADLLEANPGLAGQAAWQQQHQQLLRGFATDPRPHFKIKIIETDLKNAPRVTVRLLIFFTGQAAAPASGRLEHQATWEACWEMPETPDPAKPAAQPKLLSVKCLRCEESVSTTTSPWLADATLPLLGSLPWFQSQFNHNNEWWRTRLQKSFDHFVYGHRGLAVGDVNGDGCDDVYLCEEGGLPNRLLLQLPDGTMRDFSQESGTDIMEVTRSALFLDMDEDGDEDLVLGISHGLLMLENTDGLHFRQRTLLPKVGDAYSLAAADFDDNGYLDIYVCSYQPKNADPARLPFPAPFFNARNGGENFLVSNLGQWKFDNATQPTGLGKWNDRYSFSAVWTDYDNDGLPDLAVVNDFGQNNLFHQQRSTVGKSSFLDVTASAGLESGAFGMGITVADANRDGWLDFYTANMFSSAGNRIVGQEKFKPGAEASLIQKFRHLARGNSLFQNQRGQFTDVSGEAGVSMGRWSWGSHFVDLNNDGWEDLLVANGNITGHRTDPDL